MAFKLPFSFLFSYFDVAIKEVALSLFLIDRLMIILLCFDSFRQLSAET